MGKMARLAAVSTAALTFASASATQPAPDPVTDIRDPAHESYANCAMPKNFSKQFPKRTLKKALKKVSSSINRESPNVLQRRNVITGARVTSENVYKADRMGFSNNGRGRTFAAIGQSLGGPRNYSIMVSNTRYTKGFKETVSNELAELYIKRGAEIVSIPLSVSPELGWCSRNPAPEPDSCFSTRTSDFDVDQALFEALANSDPAQAIAVTWKRVDGEMAQCPLYFSPLSFKSVLIKIDEAYEKAASKREEQIAKGI